MKLSHPFPTELGVRLGGVIRSKNTAAPFLRWVGGKGKLLPQLLPLCPDVGPEARYFEPFLGGGAMFFARAPQNASLSDINSKLIDTYVRVRDDVELVIAEFKCYAAKHNNANRDAHYYKIRERFNSGAAPSGHGFVSAAQFIYLNKTCFNGVYRENKKGEFNVPMDTTRKKLEVDVEGLRAASAALQNVNLSCSGFSNVWKNAVAGDFVYFDPPYEPVSKTANFSAYNKSGFGREEQEELLEVVKTLDARRVNVMLSNSASPYIKDLYKDFDIAIVSASRSVNSNGARRGAVNEIVVRNY